MMQLSFERDCTVFHGAAGERLVIGTDPMLVARHWRQARPDPLQLELAIEEIEEALMAERLAHSDHGELVTSDPLLRTLPGLQGAGDRLSLADVELLFDQLAAASRPAGAQVAACASGASAAALLILRECMHHLGFQFITTTVVRSG
jgi:hypothetical protein